MNQIGALIGIGAVRRVEAFDISNTSGVESVGSMVVYEDGKPKRSDYRKFKIRTVQGPNDYASMEEVLTRRFSHGMEEAKNLRAEGKELSFGSFTRFPDLIMMGRRKRTGLQYCPLEFLNRWAFPFRYAAW